MVVRKIYRLIDPIRRIVPKYGMPHRPPDTPTGRKA